MSVADVYFRAYKDSLKTDTPMDVYDIPFLWRDKVREKIAAMEKTEADVNGVQE